jgi:hypothetical protein
MRYFTDRWTFLQGRRHWLSVRRCQGWYRWSGREGRRWPQQTRHREEVNHLLTPAQSFVQTLLFFTNDDGRSNLTTRNPRDTKKFAVLHERSNGSMKALLRNQILH